MNEVFVVMEGEWDEGGTPLAAFGSGEAAQAYIGFLPPIGSRMWREAVRVPFELQPTAASGPLSDGFKAALLAAFEVGTPEERAALYVVLQAGAIDTEMAPAEEVGMREEQLRDLMPGVDIEAASSTVVTLASALCDFTDEARQALVPGAEA